MNNPTVSTYVKGINCIYVPVSRVKESAEWYSRNLGLPILNEVNEDSTQAQLKICGNQSIFLIKTSEKTNLTYTEVNGHEQCILTLEVNDIKELYEHLKKNGAPVEEILDNAECGLSFYVKDPDGNKIDLWGGWA